MKFLGINTKSSQAGFVRNLRKWNRDRLVRRAKGNASAEQPDTLCVLGIFKNEERAIDEWIAHYLWQGANKIILIDNGSTDNSVERINAWSYDDRISVIRLERPYRQTEHYWTAIKHFDVCKKWKWLLIADLDEFWFAKNGRPLTEWLPGFKGIDVVYCNWSMFGCTENQEHPKSLREELCFRFHDLGPHGHRKYLVRAEKLTHPKMVDVHVVKNLDSARTISDNVNLQINHYYTQSLEFWTNVKMSRGDVFDPLMEKVRVLEHFNSFNSQCEFEDRLLCDLVKAQKEE